jgi:hypothetical protein
MVDMKMVVQEYTCPECGCVVRHGYVEGLPVPVPCHCEKYVFTPDPALAVDLESLAPEPGPAKIRHPAPGDTPALESD